MEARSNTADLLKGIAVLLMIQIHLIELFAHQNISKSAIGDFLLFLGGPPAAPIFILIMGYFLAATKQSAMQLVSRGVKLFILGMLLNVALNLNLFISVSQGILKIDTIPYLFGVDIFHFAGISMVLIAALKKLLGKSYIVPIGLAILSAFLGHYLLNYIPQDTSLIYLSSYFYGSSHWAYFPVFPWIAYTFLGIAFYQIQQQVELNKFKHLWIKVVMGLLFIGFLFCTIAYAIKLSANLQSYYHHGIQFFAWIVAFLLFYCFFVQQVNRIWGNTLVFKYIQWLGKNVTVIYIIQWIVIGNIATSIYKTITSPVVLALIFVAILLFCSLATLLYLKIKAGKWTSS
jgi:uncharacterized membrane protein